MWLIGWADTVSYLKKKKRQVFTGTETEALMGSKSGGLLGISMAFLLYSPLFTSAFYSLLYVHFASLELGLTWGFGSSRPHIFLRNLL